MKEMDVLTIFLIFSLHIPSLIDGPKHHKVDKVQSPKKSN